MNALKELMASFEASRKGARIVWPDFDEDGENGLFCIGTDGAPILATCEKGVQQDAEFAALAYNTMPALLGAVDTLEAIRARINGEFDHPALVKFGPLSCSSTDDILSLIKNALGELQ